MWVSRLVRSPMEEKLHNSCTKLFATEVKLPVLAVLCKLYLIILTALFLQVAQMKLLSALGTPDCIEYT